MCRVVNEFDTVDETGAVVHVSAPCMDSSMADVCYHDMKVYTGLYEPSFPEYARNARKMLGGEQIWPRT